MQSSEFDIIVVGGGGSGLAAAVAGAQNGARVLVLEKTAELGGTTVLIRTEKGNRLYQDALRQGYLEERDFGDWSQIRSEKTKMLAKAVAFSRQKQERGTARRQKLDIDGGFNGG